MVPEKLGNTSLLNGWNTDYPGIEQFYVIQVREGCGVERFNVDLRNRQRLFADTLADHSVFTSHCGADPWVTNVNGIGLLTFSLPILSAGPTIESSTPEDGAQATPGRHFLTDSSGKSSSMTASSPPVKSPQSSVTSPATSAPPYQHWQAETPGALGIDEDGEISRERVTGQIDLSHLPTTDAVFFRLAVTAE